MLQIGVTAAALIVLIGGGIYLRHFTGPMPDYQRFHGAPSSYESVPGILMGASRFDSQSLIQFGILLLIATPICRVIFGVVGFSLMKDRFYAATSTIVLVILLLSFLTRR
jgi:uncharacterized membrane protein